MRLPIPTHYTEHLASVSFSASASLPKYPAKNHCLNVAEHLPTEFSSGNGLILLYSAKAVNWPNSDQPQPFRQCRYFYYLSGFGGYDAALTYDISKKTLRLYTRVIDPKELLWSGAPEGKNEILARYNVDEVYEITSLDDHLSDYLQKHKNSSIFTLDSQQPDSSALPTAITSAFTALAKGPFFKWNDTFLRLAIDECRVIKDSFERSLIYRATKISLGAHHRARKLVTYSHGLSEADIHGLFLSNCIRAGAREQAYEPICAAGRNCATLHYVNNNQLIDGKQLVLLDAGCEVNCYATDITRTFPVGGNWTSRSKAIYDIVDRMQKVAIGRTIPGVHWAETHWLAHRVAIRGLLDLGILHNGTEEEIFQAGTSRAFFPHGLGHFIGLECHDVEGTVEKRSDIVTSQWEARLHPLDNTPSSPSFTHEGVDSYISTHSLPPSLPVGTKVARVFHPGMVLTVEPGVYFCEWIIKEYLKNDIHKKFINEKVLENYWDVGGVRIEDIVFIEQGGNRVISWEIDAEILATEEN